MHMLYMRSGTTFFAPLNCTWEVHAPTSTQPTHNAYGALLPCFVSPFSSSCCFGVSKNEEMSPSRASSVASKFPS